MSIRKPKFWDYKELSSIAIFLLPISFFLILLSFLKKKLTITKNFKVPILCVGNIYIGGTGKTPLSIKLYEILKSLKKNPAIIKKYYKNQRDEIDLIRKVTKNVIVGSTRAEAVLSAQNKGYDSLILDDGYQDYSIKKDLNILCFNEKQLLGNGLTLPSGPLRESASGVKNSKLIIINGKKNIKFERKIKEFSNKIKIFYSNYIPINYGKFKNKKLIAFAGIGNPENFFSLLKQCKLDVKKKVSFPDHYLYTKKDLKNLRALSKRNNCELITTEKDYFRIKNLGYGNINFLLIKLKILKKLELIEELKKYI